MPEVRGPSAHRVRSLVKARTPDVATATAEASRYDYWVSRSRRSPSMARSDVVRGSFLGEASP